MAGSFRSLAKPIHTLSTLSRFHSSAGNQAADQVFPGAFHPGWAKGLPGRDGGSGRISGLIGNPGASFGSRKPGNHEQNLASWFHAPCLCFSAPFAKRFTDSFLAPGAEVTLSTTKPDKYDRYLADVFVPAEPVEPLFLNNALLENGHAEHKDEWEFGDWGM
jgi:hypothetical protein